MNISVFGLGYVGTITSACLCHNGHKVIGVDIKNEKIEAINRGESPIVEPKVKELIESARAQNLLSATNDVNEAIRGSELALICVGTPSKVDGSLDLKYVKRVVNDIGKSIRNNSKQIHIVLRSTVLPGTIEQHVVPNLEQIIGKKHGNGYWVLFHPEFLREGNAVEDFFQPPKIVIGEVKAGSGNILAKLYKSYDAKIFKVSVDVAEALKYADNTFHALKITFANEMGRIFKSSGIDSREVMDIFKSDRKLNISKKYLNPGFAFGGSCLPKDLKAIQSYGNLQGLKIPMLDSVLDSNKVNIDMVEQKIESFGCNNVALVGLAFKPGTDDLRESPYLELAKYLILSGKELKVYDPLVMPEKLLGTNKRYLRKHILQVEKHFINSLNDIHDFDIVIIGHPISKDDMSKLLVENSLVLDLVGNVRGIESANYEGFLW